MMTNKPFVKESEVTYEMITTHPYFRKIAFEDLQKIINSMKYEEYLKLSGRSTSSYQKTQLLQESWKAPVYNSYAVYANTYEEAEALTAYQDKLFGGCEPARRYTYYRFSLRKDYIGSRYGRANNRDVYGPGRPAEVDHIFDSFQDWKAYMGQKEEAKPDNRKIVGYKLPVSIYNNNIPAGTVYQICNAAYIAVPVSNKKGDMSNSLPSEIVKTWEPVYEEQKPKAFHIVITGTPHTEFYIQVDGIIRIPKYNSEMSIANLKSIIKSLTEIIDNKLLMGEYISINDICLCLGIGEGLTIKYGELLLLQQIYKIHYE